jgi:hypothetical protein
VWCRKIGSELTNGVAVCGLGSSVGSELTICTVWWGTIFGPLLFEGLSKFVLCVMLKLVVCCLQWRRLGTQDVCRLRRREVSCKVKRYPLCGVCLWRREVRSELVVHWLLQMLCAYSTVTVQHFDVGSYDVGVVECLRWRGRK